MILSVRKISRVVRLVLYVTLFTLIGYKCLVLVQEMFAPVDKYRLPAGQDAIKVNATLPSQTAPEASFWEEARARLGLFYELGE